MKRAIQMIHVSSSQIVSVGYDKKTKTLHVEFPGSTYYSYDDVPESTFTELLEADSVGSYFSRNIKTSFVYHKIR